MRDTDIDRALTVWQPKTHQQLNGEDARQIVENITGFFDILLEWESAELDSTASVSEYEFSDTVRYVSKKGD